MEKKATLLQANPRPLKEKFEKVSSLRDGISSSLEIEGSDRFFDNLVWLNSVEAAQYLRKSVGALRTMVCRGHLQARKFRRRLYFKRRELDRLLDTSELRGGF